MERADPVRSADLHDNNTIKTPGPTCRIARDGSDKQLGTRRSSLCRLRKAVDLAVPRPAKVSVGQFKIIRRGELDGHKAIELGITGLSGSKASLHVTAARLWVDAASYLPLRQMLRFSTGRVDIGYFRFLPPTAANLAKLRVVIPAGYHRTWLRPGQWRHRHHR